LDYEKPVSTGAQAKNLIGSFLPFSTASTQLRHAATGISALHIAATKPRRKISTRTSSLQARAVRRKA
jgi:hypothetical protein